MSGEAESAGQVHSWDTNTMPWEIRHIDELDGDLAAKQLTTSITRRPGQPEPAG
jgi:hypothetical protein